MANKKSSEFNRYDWNSLGFITGVDRSEYADLRKSHLYLAERDSQGMPLIMDPLFPMCEYGYNRDDRTAFSIFRNNVSKRGICKICARKAIKFVEKYPIGKQLPESVLSIGQLEEKVKHEAQRFSR